MRILFKVIRFLWLAVHYLSRAFFIHFTTKDPDKRLRKFVDNAHWANVKVLHILNVKVSVKNFPPQPKKYLVVGNHMGFLDVFIMSSALPNSVFVTSQEMRETPVLGLICEMAGCIFVERRSREGIPNEIKKMTATLNKGFNVVLYPEGTSGNAEKVLPFKKSLLTAASNSDANIMPVVTNFTHINGEAFSHKYRDYVCWYGDMDFLSAITRLFGLKEIRAEVRFLDEIHTHSESDRREIAAQAQAQIEKYFVKIPIPGAMAKPEEAVAKLQQS